MIIKWWLGNNFRCAGAIRSVKHKLTIHFKTIVPWEAAGKFPCKCLAPFGRAADNCRLCGSFFCGDCLVSISCAEVRQEDAKFMGLSLLVCNGLCSTIAKGFVTPKKITDSHAQIVRRYESVVLFHEKLVNIVDLAMAEVLVALKLRDYSKLKRELLELHANPVTAEQRISEARILLRGLDKALQELAGIKLEAGDAKLCAKLIQRYKVTYLEQKAKIDNMEVSMQPPKS